MTSFWQWAIVPEIQLFHFGLLLKLVGWAIIVEVNSRFSISIAKGFDILAPVGLHQFVLMGVLGSLSKIQGFGVLRFLFFLL
jgi:hypothetical protein